MKYQAFKTTILLFVLTLKVGLIFANQPTKTLVFEKRTYGLEDFSRKIDTVQFVVLDYEKFPVPAKAQSELKNENPFAGTQYMMFNDLLKRPTDCSIGILHGGDKFTFYYDEDLEVVKTAEKMLPIPTKIVAVTHNQHIEFTLME